MSTYDFDLAVIGGGSGGVRAARWSASLGASVAIVEEDRYGGTCVLRGCIPKKLMTYASHFSNDIQTARDFGLTMDIKSHDWNFFRKARERELSRLAGLYQDILEKNKVTLFQGRASFKDKHTLCIRPSVHGPDAQTPQGEQQRGQGIQEITAKNILIAVGSRPHLPPLPGIEYALNSDDFFQLKERPEKILIVGGGFIGVEFSCLLNHLGTEVHLLTRGKKILRNFDSETAAFLQESMAQEGIHFHHEENILSLQKEGNQRVAFLKKGKKLKVDHVLMATGRVPYTEGLGLENIPLSLDEKGAIPVDKFSQTAIDSLFAVGDVTNRLNLTPVALREGMLVAENIFAPQGNKQGDNQERKEMSYENIPSAVFSSPPLSTVGLTEQSAREKNIDFEVYTSTFRPLKYTLGKRQIRTFMKMIVEKKTEKVLGIHMVGDDAPEIIQGFAVALKAGATKKVFDQTIGVHPSSAEEFVTMRTARKSNS